MSSQTRDIAKATVAANLVSEMTRAKLTPTQVGAAIGTNERQVRRWANGEHLPGHLWLRELGQLFDRDPDWFYVVNDLEECA